MADKFKGQLKQDLLCLEYFNHKREGYFVDIGAGNGYDLSNTYLLEKEYDWKGICVEPLLEPYKLCEECRTNSICRNTAIYNKNSEVEFSYIDGSSGENYMYSGITKDIKHHTEKVNKECKKVLMNTITLNQLLDEAEAPEIMDFLSIDTEGSECKILEALDHDKYKFRYITVEHNYNTEQRVEIARILTTNGYKFHMENKWDDIYVIIS